MFKTIKSQLLIALTIQFIVLIGVVSTTVYLVNLRQHDYLILNLSAQLRLIARALTQQSNLYLDDLFEVQTEVASLTKSNHITRLYRSSLNTQLNNFHDIVVSLEQRSISSELLDSSYIIDAVKELPSQRKVPSITQQPTKLICKWDKSSRSQMSKTAKIWFEYEQELRQLISKSKKSHHIEKVAEFVVLNEDLLNSTTSTLAVTFRVMMEDKLAQIKMLNQFAVAFILLISLTILLIIYKQVFKPIDTAVKGFKRVALGELSHQIDYESKNEIGKMTRAFNSLTRRISTMFRLTNVITGSDTLDKTLETIYKEFPSVLPIDWVGILRTTQDHLRYSVDREFSEHYTVEQLFNNYVLTNTLFKHVEKTQQPYCSGVSETQGIEWESDRFLQDLHKTGLMSVFYLPIIKSQEEQAVLVLATKEPNAYTEDDLEYLTNLADQVKISFEKTIGMESLVISSVKGLAKLAESRDPETGDHLFRMSHYSAYIAEELSNSSKYQNKISTAYVRQIFQFAPMHDIGKVGVSDSILLKPGGLTKEEFELMQVHPTVGADVLKRCEHEMLKVGRSIFQVGIEIAEGHHEKFDGTGYPNKLSGEDIPLSARIIAVGDVFDALTSKRPYKEAWPIEKAIALIHEESGKHFDPEVVSAFDRSFDKIIKIYNKYKHV